MLEINARFNLWHNPGAVAGVNLPATVHADLTGRPRPSLGPVRPGATWVQPVLLSAGVLRRELPARSLAAVVTASSRSTGDWDDLGPLVRGMLVPRARRALRCGDRRS